MANVNVYDEDNRGIASRVNNQIKNSNIPATKVLNQSADTNTISSSVDDDGFSQDVRDLDPSRLGPEIDQGRNSDTFKSIYHSANIFGPNEYREGLYDKVFRFGNANPYSAIGSARELLFFTKPDLHIMYVEDSARYSTGNLTPSTTEINPGLKSIPFWEDLISNRKRLVGMLQSSTDPNLPFNYLLQNQCKSNLDIPALSSDMVDTPVNNYGVGYSYRGSSEASDDSPEFSLEFKDNKYLDTYYFFKAYEEYETLKHHGVISPPKKYIIDRILHDCFSIYKFIIADDMETIIYWGKMYGVIPKSLPRDVFSNPNFDEGLSYSIDFKAAFYEDMRPEILADFNALGQALYDSKKYNIGPFNDVLGRVDTRPAEAAHIVVDYTSAAAIASPTGYVYKIKWKGDSKY